MKATLLYLGFVAFLTGIVLGTIVPLTHATFGWLLCFALLVILILHRAKERWWFAAGVVLLLVIGGAWRVSIHESQFGISPLLAQVGERVELRGEVVREPDVREATTHLYVQVGDDLLLVTTDRYAFVSYGDVVVVKGVVREPEAFTTDLGRTFNYPGYLRARGVEYQMNFATVEVTASGEGNRLIQALLHFKNSFLLEINTRLPEPVAGLGAGVLLGVKQALGEDLEQAFRETGIIHIVVLSGYNIMLVVVFLTFILGSFLSVRAKFVVGVLGIIAFALLVGFSATVVRACLMASIMLFAEATGRRYLALRALCVAGALMLLLNPSLLLYDIGFQLSFVATLGLILFSPYITTMVSFIPERLQLRQFFAATVSTQIAVLPLLMYQIGEVSLVGLVVNLLVLPMVPVAMLMTFILGMLGLLLPIFASLALWPAYLSLRYIIEIAELFAAWPLAAMAVPTFTRSGLVMMYGLYAVGIAWLLRHHPLESLGRPEITAATSLPVSETLTGWTIEEEFGVPSLTKERDVIEKGGAAQRAAPPDDNLPIFFR